jgi:4-hydroxybenzoate polyprenyltransferase
MLILFAISAVGFAALGYLINETFDVEQDTIAGKQNQIASLTYPIRAIIYLLAAFLAFVPWCWLPTSKMTCWLIMGELTCLLAYSAPFPRLKNIPIVAEFLDMAYAYLIPAILSLHTFSGIGSPHSYQIWQWLLLVGVAFTGLRNILIHRFMDREYDLKSNLLTVPIQLGEAKTFKLIVVLLLAEIACFAIVWLILSSSRVYAVIFGSVFLVFLFCMVLNRRKHANRHLISIEKWMHLLDPYYQMVFPLLMLLVISLEQPWWTVYLLAHAGFFLPTYMMRKSYLVCRIYVVNTFIWFKIFVNIAIYFLFRVFGVDLRKEQTDAMGYLRAKFKG